MSGGLSVLFIGAHVRSGSTLLGRVLGSTPGFVYVGEIRRIWDRGLVRGDLCGCGLPFDSCPFWSAVVKDAFGGPPDGPRLLAERDAAIRLRDVFRGRDASRGPGHEEFDRALAKVYRSVAKVADCHTVVDSSKDIAYGRYLGSMEGFRMRYCHLVRDSRGVAFSELKRSVRQETGGEVAYMMRRPAARSAAMWMLSNALWTRFVGRRGGSRVRYEDLTADPERVLSALPGARERAASGAIPADGAVELGTSHSVSGNPMRFETGSVAFEPDVEWVDRLTGRDWATVTSITWPALLRYGYGLGRTGAVRG
jgi:hypothetical protein